MSDNQELINRCNKMSFLLGLALGSLTEIIRIETLPNCTKQPVVDALNQLMKGIEELYYSEAPK